ncbi:mechanosensitive ion channel domain-containing protein, partial [Aquiflexum sp.]|uniref:mechanosensitive ion channel domain-containing protein n=1 Tax=Aquiflexum sp. TaxID=1872584 RepID=UPI00359457D0
MELRDNIFKSFTDIWDSIYDSAPAILAALIVFAIFYLIGFFLRRLFKRRVMLRVTSSIVASFAGEGLFWLFSILGFLAASRILGFTGLAGSILAGAGISAIIFGFAFKDILENFLAGILLAFQKPFKVGDIIQIDKFKGPVRALELR